jgi:transcription elongation regulator 1
VDADFDKLEGLYNAWVKKRVIEARRDFDVLLSESPILEHWGRLKQEKKSGKGEEIKGGLEDDEDEEGGDDAIDIKSMAAQVDLTAVQAVLKVNRHFSSAMSALTNVFSLQHDKRFLIFNHVPEDRVKWIEEFMNNLAAPDLTVHSRTQ